MARTHAKQSRKELRDAVNKYLEEYIVEAEHQDGYGYWNQFGSVKEALADFGLYLTNVAEVGEEEAIVKEPKSRNDSPIHKKVRALIASTMGDSDYQEGLVEGLYDPPNGPDDVQPPEGATIEESNRFADQVTQAIDEVTDEVFEFLTGLSAKADQ